MIDRLNFLGICESVLGNRFYSQHVEDFDYIFKQCFQIEYGESYDELVLSTIEDDVFSPITDVMDDLPF